MNDLKELKEAFLEGFSTGWSAFWTPFVGLMRPFKEAWKQMFNHDQGHSLRS